PTADPVSGSTPPPPPQPPCGRPRPRQLRRRPDEGPIAGVCAGVAEYFNVDPVIVRIAAVVLLFTGPGFFAYILAWIFVPAAEGPYAHSFSPRAVDRHERGAQVFGIVLLAVSLSILWGGWWSPARRWFFPLGLMALGAWLLLRRDRDEDDPATPPHGGPPTPWGAPGLTHDLTTDDTLLGDSSGDDTLVGEAATDPTTLDQPTTGAGSGRGGIRPPWAHAPWGQGGWGHGPPAEVPEAVRVARRRRRMVFPIVLGALLLWTGIAFLANVSPKSGLAIALCIVGVGFVLGAFVGGSKALIVPAVVLGAALVVTSAVDLPLSGPVGDRTWTPATIADVEDLYELSVGEGLLDLTELRLGADDRLEVAATIGVGHLVIHVPDGAALEVDAEASGGDVVVLGQSNSGLGVSVDRSLGGDGSEGTIALDLKVGFGQIEIIAMPGPAEVPSTTTPTSVLG
ncbi:MAG: PspC domain-containing protein, partial [Acidimicrobiales bacterium]